MRKDSLVKDEYVTYYTHLTYYAAPTWKVWYGLDLPTPSVRLPQPSHT